MHFVCMKNRKNGKRHFEPRKEIQMFRTAECPSSPVLLASGLLHQRETSFCLKPLYLGVLSYLSWPVAYLVLSYFICREAVKSNNFLEGFTAGLINWDVYRHAKDLRRI